MARKRFKVRAECPACACGSIDLSPEELRERFIGDEKEIEVLCPQCGTKHIAEITEEEEGED